MNKCVVRIKYSKKYPANLVGHLDLIMNMQRAMRRALWPLDFTCGFNPRVKISCAPPLSLGFSSDAEYIDVYLRSDLSDYQIEAFNTFLIDGVKVLNLLHLPHDSAGINDRIIAFRYKIEFEDEIKISEKYKGAEIEKIEKDYLIMKIEKANGGFRNPLKILGEGKFNVRKIDCILEEIK